MILCDRTIRTLVGSGEIVIDPFEDSYVQPASVDVRIDDTFLIFRRHACSEIDPTNLPDDLMDRVRIGSGKAFVLHPGEFVLGTTLERLTLPHYIVARIEGKSSLGRLGLLIHATAGFVDPGWMGQLTLELSNVSPIPILLWPGMKIGQLSFIKMDGLAEYPYGHPALGSRYQGQHGPTASRFKK